MTRRLASLGLWTLIALLVVYVSVSKVVPVATGTTPLTLMGTSMQPTYRVGSMVFIDTKAEPKVGDVITFAGFNAKYWTHRIVALTHSMASMDELRYQTKGDDPNLENDPFVVDPKDVKGVVAANIPYIGYIDVWLQSAGAWAFLLGLGLLLNFLSQPPNAVPRRLATYVSPPKRRRSRNRTQQRLYDLFPST